VQSKKKKYQIVYKKDTLMRGVRNREYAFNLYHFRLSHKARLNVNSRGEESPIIYIRIPFLHKADTKN
jgi:hypothetical protein